MIVQQIDLNNKKQIKGFLELPFKIYKNIKQWVPPLRSEVALMLNPKSHPFYKHSSAAFFLVYDDQQIPLGRVAVLNNRKYNDYNHDSSAFFYLFECENNQEAACGLFDAVSEWVERQGLCQIIGPKGFSALDGMGLLVQGFEHRPAFGIPYNPAYYQELLRGCGYQLTKEIVSGYMDRNTNFPQRILEAALIVQKRTGLRVAEFKKRSDLRMLIPKLKEMYNGALEGTTGNFPISDEEARAMADQLLMFADPRLIKIIMEGEDPVGFLFAYPDISAALQRTKGRLFPFGWLDMLLELKRTKWININGAGIIEKYRGQGGTAILFSEMYKSLINNRFEYIDVVQIGADNDRMQNELRTLGIKFYKKHAIFERVLNH